MPNTPSLKNRRVYEALRRKGMPKSQAARISNAQTQKDSGVTGLAIPPTGPNALFNQMGITSRRRTKKRKSVCTCKAAAGAPGEKIAPGITRIRGNLCNVHGRYGPCDKGGAAKKPKGGAAKKPKKVVQTPDEKRAARAAEQSSNRTNVLRSMNIAPDGQAALEALRAGQQPDPDAIARGGFVEAGLVERATDGSYRLSASGRAALTAAGTGDQGRTGDTISSARDRATARSERTAAAAERKRQADQKRVGMAARRAERAKKRPAKIKEVAPIFAVFKDARGADRWLGITTTAYVDVDNEIISTKAIGQAVAIGDLTQQRGPLRYWHVPGLDIGDCDYQAQGGPGGRFLIESGTFRSKGCAKLGQRMTEKGYQMSPGFVHARTQPKNGVYDDIAIYERSPVPNGRAANRFTKFATKEDRMLTTEKEIELKTLLADQPDLLNQLLARVERTDKAAQSIGVTYKEETPAPTLPNEIMIGGVVYTAKEFPPPAAAAVEEDVAGDVEEVVEEEAADNGGMDDNAFSDLIVQKLLQGLLPHLDIEKKVSGYVNELKGLVSGFAQQKDDASTAQAAQIAALDAKLKELTGDLPSSVMSGAARMYRPSEAPGTLLTAEGEKKLKELTQQAPAGLTDPAEIAAYQLIWGNQ